MFYLIAIFVLVLVVVVLTNIGFAGPKRVVQRLWTGGLGLMIAAAATEYLTSILYDSFRSPVLLIGFLVGPPLFAYGAYVAMERFIWRYWPPSINDRLNFNPNDALIVIAAAAGLLGFVTQIGFTWSEVWLASLMLSVMTSFALVVGLLIFATFNVLGKRSKWKFLFEQANADRIERLRRFYQNRAYTGSDAESKMAMDKWTEAEMSQFLYFIDDEVLIQNQEVINNYYWSNPNRIITDIIWLIGVAGLKERAHFAELEVEVNVSQTPPEGLLGQAIIMIIFGAYSKAARTQTGKLYVYLIMKLYAGIVRSSPPPVYGEARPASSREALGAASGRAKVTLDQVQFDE